MNGLIIWNSWALKWWVVTSYRRISKRESLIKTWSCITWAPVTPVFYTFHTITILNCTKDISTWTPNRYRSAHLMLFHGLPHLCPVGCGTQYQDWLSTLSITWHLMPEIKWFEIKKQYIEPIYPQIMPVYVDGNACIVTISCYWLIMEFFFISQQADSRFANNSYSTGRTQQHVAYSRSIWRGGSSGCSTSHSHYCNTQKVRTNLHVALPTSQGEAHHKLTNQSVSGNMIILTSSQIFCLSHHSWFDQSMVRPNSVVRPNEINMLLINWFPQVTQRSCLLFVLLRRLPHFPMKSPLGDWRTIYISMYMYLAILLKINLIRLQYCSCNFLSIVTRRRPASATEAPAEDSNYSYEHPGDGAELDCHPYRVIDGQSVGYGYGQNSVYGYEGPQPNWRPSLGDGYERPLPSLPTHKSKQSYKCVD